MIDDVVDADVNVDPFVDPFSSILVVFFLFDVVVVLSFLKPKTDMKRRKMSERKGARPDGRGIGSAGRAPG